jgi:L-2-hydroxyglutarate oxidase LhgO
VETVDTCIIGAGVVGLAIAAELAEAGREVIVCEKEGTAGTGISARNSGVIHAGVYYPKDSLKARLCVQGKGLLYRFCEDFGVEHQRIGKLIVATNPDEVAKLAVIMAAAAANGVTDLRFMSKSEIKAREPALAVEAALWSPSTGIVDVAAFILALEGVLEAAGGVVAYGTAITAVAPGGSGFEITTAQGDRFLARQLVNAAGLGAQALAASTKGLAGVPNAGHVPPLRLVRGHYFSLGGQSPFKTLVYPVPVTGGLGIHASLDTGGQVRFGPDVEPVEAEDYAPDANRETSFRTAISRYYPGIESRTITPDFVGIRPQIAQLGTFADFRIDGAETHGVQGLVNLYGIESPGLTAALAIGKHVAAVLRES